MKWHLIITICLLKTWLRQSLMSKVHADCVEKTVGDTILFLHNSNENLAVFLIGRNWIHKTYTNKVEGWKWNFTVRLLWCGNIPLHFKWEVFFFLFFLGDGIETYFLIWTKPVFVFGSCIICECIKRREKTMHSNFKIGS